MPPFLASVTRPEKVEPVLPLESVTLSSNVAAPVTAKPLLVARVLPKVARRPR